MPDLEATILIIFGMTGDLSRRKLLPALYNLVCLGLLDESTQIVGVSRGNTSIDDVFKNVNFPTADLDEKALQTLRNMTELLQLDVDEPAEYKKLASKIEALEAQHGGPMNHLFYLSVPPKVAEPIITSLGENDLNKHPHSGHTVRLLIEKPFGYDYASAEHLSASTAQHFNEDQLYRIDHYLAKETVQNILAFRFNNPIFEPLWNRWHIESIELTATETIDIEGRAQFYEQTGALRDLIQSHLLQVLALITMERPKELNSDGIHESKFQAMSEIISIEPEQIADNTIRGQYAGYKEEVDNPDSVTETFASIKVEINNERWEGVPVVLTSGKALHEKATKISINFRPTAETKHHNVLTFRLQPNEGIELDLRVKKPGFIDEIEPAHMDFSYDTHFNNDRQPDAYERVLVDAFRGEQTLFASTGEVLESWRVVHNVLCAWKQDDQGMQSYDKGSSGPEVSLAG